MPANPSHCAAESAVPAGVIRLPVSGGGGTQGPPLQMLLCSHTLTQAMHLWALRAGTTQRGAVSHGRNLQDLRKTRGRQTLTSDGTTKWPVNVFSISRPGILGPSRTPESSTQKTPKFNSRGVFVPWDIFDTFIIRASVKMDALNDVSDPDGQYCRNPSPCFAGLCLTSLLKGVNFLSPMISSLMY